MPFIKGQSGNPAGRPRKAEQYAGAIAKAEKRIADRLPELIDNMFKLASGVYVPDTDKEGNQIGIYLTPPDRAANQYLIDRILGKPTERSEISGPDGGPVVREVIIEIPTDEPVEPTATE